MDAIRDIISGFVSFSSDTIVIAILIAIGAAYAYTRGKGGAIALVLSFYPAVILFKYIPLFKEQINLAPQTFGEALPALGVFVVLWGLLNWVLERFITSDFSYSPMRKLIECLILGAVTAGLLILFSYHIVNLESIYNFGTGVDRIFSDSLFFWWLAVPFVILFVLG